MTSLPAEEKNSLAEGVSEEKIVGQSPPASASVQQYQNGGEQFDDNQEGVDEIIETN